MNDIIKIGALDHQNLGRRIGYGRSRIKKWRYQERPSDNASRDINVVVTAFLGTNRNYSLFKDIESVGVRTLLA
jgi:hypothetical protein